MKHLHERQDSIIMFHLTEWYGKYGMITTQLTNNEIIMININHQWQVAIVLQNRQEQAIVCLEKWGPLTSNLLIKMHLNFYRGYTDN